MHLRTRLTFPAAILMIVVSGCAAPAGASSPTGAAEPTSTQVASASGSLESASPSPAPGTLPVEGFATVIVEGLYMRQEPGLDADPVQYACIDGPCDAPIQLGGDDFYSELYLLEGPVQADGHDWYLAAAISENMHAEYIGWLAAGDEAGPWLVSHEADCPQQPIELGDVTIPSLSRIEAIACFGGEELTIEGWYVELPEDAEEPGVCSAEPAWIVCGWGYHMLRPQESGWYGDGNHLQMKVDPESGVEMPARGNWVIVTGMFDHPGAQDCRGGESSVSFTLMCRMEFVVTSARLAE